MTPPAFSAEWSRAIEMFPRFEPGPGRDPSAEELAGIAARAAEVRASEEFRSRHVPSERRQGISFRSWDGGKSGTARRHGGLGRDSDPEHVDPTTPARAARRAIRDFRRTLRPRKDHPMSTTNGAATANGTERECFECGVPTGVDGLCRNAPCSRGIKPREKPAMQPLPPPAPTPACPDCGTPYGKRRRCYSATCPSGVPGIRPGTKLPHRGSKSPAPAPAVEPKSPASAPAPKPPATAPDPVAPSPRRDDRAARLASPPSPALRRLDAARRVIEALDALGDPAEVAAVLDLARAAMIGGDR